MKPSPKPGKTMTRKKTMPPKQRSGIQSLDLKDELLLYDGKEDAVHVLNKSARLIWDSYLKGETIDEIEARLKAAFEPPPDQDLKDDIRRFIEKLKGKKVVEP